MARRAATTRWTGRSSSVEPARRHSPPNPWVGCVIVRDGEVVGEGATEPPGGPHAEVVALARAGERARGATAYVTLEPCAHHGRTPPCTDALIDAGVARVVIALEDPDPQVAGAGSARLHDHGITRRRRCRRGARSRIARAVPAPPPHRSGRSPAEDRDEPRRPHRRGRRLVAVDHRARSARRRARAPRRVAGRRRRRRYRARRPPGPHRPRRRDRRVGAPAAARPARRARARPGGRPAVRHRRSRRRSSSRPKPRRAMPSTRGAPPARRSRPSPPGGRRASTSTRRSRCSDADGVLQAMFEGGGERARRVVDSGARRPLVAYVAPTVLGADGAAAFARAGPAATLADAPRGDLARRRASAPTSASTTTATRGRLMFTGIVEELGRVRARHRQRGWRAARDRRAPRCSTTPRSARRSRSTAAA